MSRAIKHLVDGRWTTVSEVASELGYKPQQIYNQIHNTGCGLQGVVTMIREGRVLNGDRGVRHMVNGQWMTIRQIADMLGVKPRSLYNYRARHKHPDGSAMSYVELVEAFQSGKVRHGGRKPIRHRVGRRTMTVYEAARMLGVNANALRIRMYRKKQRLSTVIRYYESKKKRQAEEDIMKILKGE